MQLNIHIIIHPIVQKLSNEAIYDYCKLGKSKIYSNNNRKLEMLILYESVRKSITGENIYIRKVDYLEEKYLLNRKRKYLIIADLIESYSVISETNSLIPGNEIRHVSLKEILTDSKNKSIFNYLNNKNFKNCKIIIFEKFLNRHSVIEILEYLTNKMLARVNQIQITCIACNQRIIKQIGKKYPNLSIYTAKISKN